MPFCNHWHGNPTACGLIFYLPNFREPVPVPLKSVKLRTRIIDFVAEVELEQEYVNSERNPIEAQYLFPVEEEAAVIDFEAILDGRTIETKVKEKEEARNEYQDAVKHQKTAFLVEEHSSDVFQIKIGHLKPGAGAKTVLKYVIELPVAEENTEAVRLTVPTTIAPRYTPPTDNSEFAQKLAQIKYSLDTPAPLTIEANVISKHKITSITSPSHSLKNGENETDSEMDGLFHSKKVLQGTITDMDRDFVLLVHAEQLHEPRIFMETSDELGGVAGMVSLVPNFKLDEQKTELIFLVDRSGSMGWGFNGKGSIEQAKEALLLFLHSLPVDCIFDIYSFGSRFDSLFHGKSTEYTDDSLQAAKAHVRSMSANYGGTEIYSPLERIFKEPPKEGYLRQIFVLTDGAVSNSDQVVQLVRKHNHQGRVFSLGLGASASRHLVKGIARAGGGTAVFATENEDLRPKVMSQLKNSLQPAISQVSVEWKGVPPVKGIAVEPPVETKKTLLGYMKPKAKATVSMHGQAPARIPPIYDGHRLLAYRLFEAEEKPTGVLITAQSPDGPLKVDLELQESDSIEGSFVHQLAARKRIQDLEEDVDFDADAIKQAITQLGLKYKLASKHTSFVGIDPKQGRNFYCQMFNRDVPNQVPHGFGSGGAMNFALSGRGGYGRGRGGSLNAHITLGCSKQAAKGAAPIPGACPASAAGSIGFCGKASINIPMGSAGAFFGGASRNSALTQGQQQQQQLQQHASTGFGASGWNSAAPVPTGNSSAFDGAVAYAGFASSGTQSSAPPPAAPSGFAFGAPQRSMSPAGALAPASGFAAFQPHSTAAHCAASFGGNAPIEQTQSDDPVTLLMNLQLSSGEFKWDDKLATVLQVSKAELASIAGKSGLSRVSEDESVWITVACICYLETRAADMKDLWELMVIKSKKFICKKIGDAHCNSLLQHFKAHMVA